MLIITYLTDLAEIFMDKFMFNVMLFTLPAVTV